MFETYGIYVLVAGIVLALAGYIWLLLRAWGHDWRWGLALVLFPPASLLFLAVEFRRVVVPANVFLVGLLLILGTLGLNVLVVRHIDLGPREKIVDGELHLTLNGWDRPADDYAVLEMKPNTVVLQMANSDVTDETVGFLAGLQKLQELDLNDTQVTDTGLAVLAQLPRLRVLRLRGTKITNDGFREHLLAKPTLLELDVRETEVASKTLRAWKNADKERRRYLK